MSESLILPRRFYSQPPGYAEIDWSNPLTNGLWCAFNGATKTDAVTEREFTQIGSVETRGSGIGAGVYSDASADVLSITGMLPITTGEPVTAWVLTNCNVQNSTRKRQIRLSGSNYGTAIAADFGDGTLSYISSAFQTASGSFVYASTSSTNLINQFEDIFLWHSGGTSALYADIRRLGIYTSSSSGDRRESITQIYIGNSSSSYPSFSIIPLTYVWRRVLSADERKLLRENPWQIFKAK